MKILPKDLQLRAMQDKAWDDYPNAPTLKECALRRIRDTQHLRLAYGGRATLVASMENDDDDDIKAEVLALPGTATEEQVMAMERKRFQRRQVKKRPGPTRTPQKTNTANASSQRKPRCGNCLEEGHATKDCKKLRVPAKDRPCFNCGERGHTALYGPKPKKGIAGKASNTIEEAEEELVCLATAYSGGCTQSGRHNADGAGSNEDFKLVQSRRGSRLHHRTSTNNRGPMTLLDFVDENKYAHLREEESTEIVSTSVLSSDVITSPADDKDHKPRRHSGGSGQWSESSVGAFPFGKRRSSEAHGGSIGSNMPINLGLSTSSYVVFPMLDKVVRTSSPWRSQWRKKGVAKPQRATGRGLL